IPARVLLTPGQLAALRTRVAWRGPALILHAWAVILGSVALTAVFPPFLPIAVMLIGSRQLGLAILMHDGAHGALASGERLNMALSQWFCAWPVLADTASYRRYHLAHHAHTQQAEDPDLVLSAPFPITRASYRRKFWRDITGQTGFQQRRAQFANALGDPSGPWPRRLARLRERLGPQIAVNLLLLAGFTAAGVWWAYPLLWVLPLLTWFMVITRIRNIAEHAVVPDSTDPFRNTRTTRANLLERAFIAPYYVNYHLEHHLLFWLPCWRLPALHRILMAGPHGPRMEVREGYRAVMRMATAKPDTEDARGAIVSNVRRRAQGAARVNEDQAGAGF
ncbi:MAG: fatty acid desaturase family protein, partial [Acetobacteraceae bacterium]|nr:fatty acid desaturase family protein [Acetobacteraceae bacterium]